MHDQLHSFQDNARVNGSSKNMLAYVLLSFLVFEQGFIQIRFGIFEFFNDIFSIKFYTISFLCKHNFFIDEKHTQWMLDTKVKVLHLHLERKQCAVDHLILPLKGKYVF